MNDGRKWHDQAHPEKSPWRVALEGVVIVVLFVLVMIAMSICETCG